MSRRPRPTPAEQVAIGGGAVGAVSRETDRLRAELDAVRTAIREAHEVLQDLNAAIKEARLRKAVYARDFEILIEEVLNEKLEEFVEGSARQLINIRGEIIGRLVEAQDRLSARIKNFYDMITRLNDEAAKVNGPLFGVGGWLFSEKPPDGMQFYPVILDDQKENDGR